MELTKANKVGLLLALALAGCTADQAPLTQTAPGGTNATSQVIAGQAARNFMQSGAVTASAVNSDGSTGATLGTTTVNSDGTFTVTLANTTTGPIRVSVSGGSYTSELDGSSQTTATSITALIDSTSTIPATLSVTPLTTIVDAVATTKVAAGTPLATAHQTANNAVMASYGFPTGSTAETSVPDFTASATGSPALTLAVLGGLEAESSTLGLSDRGALVTALAQDASDGKFDGTINGQPIALGSGTLSPTAGTTSFLAGVSAFTAARVGQIPGLSAANTTIGETLPTSPLATGNSTTNTTGINTTAVQADLSQGFVDLQKGTNAGYVAARSDFALAYNQVGSTVSTLADQARFFYAITQITGLAADIGSNSAQTSVGGLLTSAGFSTTDRNGYNQLVPPTTYPSTTPTGDQVRAFLQGTVQNTLVGAINALNAIQTNFAVSWSYSPANPNGASTHTSPVLVSSDYADVLMFRAAARLLLGGTQEVSEYNLGGSLATFLNGSSRTIQSFLSDNPTALDQSDTTELTTVQSNLSGSIDDFTAAVQAVQARTGSAPAGTYLITLNGSAANVQKTLTNLATYKTYLTAAGTTQAGDGSSATLNLPTYFADGLSLRQFLPPFLGNNVNGLYQGTPFGAVYSGYPSNGESNPNYDSNGDGLPDSLVSKPIPQNESIPVGSLVVGVANPPLPNGANTIYYYDYATGAQAEFPYTGGAIPTATFPNIPAGTDTVTITVNGPSGTIADGYATVNVTDGQISPINITVTSF